MTGRHRVLYGTQWNWARDIVHRETGRWHRTRDFWRRGQRRAGEHSVLVADLKRELAPAPAFVYLGDYRLMSCRWYGAVTDPANPEGLPATVEFVDGGAFGTIPALAPAVELVEPWHGKAVTA